MSLKVTTDIINGTVMFQQCYGMCDITVTISNIDTLAHGNANIMATVIDQDNAVRRHRVKGNRFTSCFESCPGSYIRIRFEGEDGTPLSISGMAEIKIRSLELHPSPSIVPRVLLYGITGAIILACIKVLMS